LLRKRFWYYVTATDFKYLILLHFLFSPFCSQQEILYSATPLRAASHRLHTSLSTGIVEKFISA
jgi:hypothetical protein